MKKLHQADESPGRAEKQISLEMGEREWVEDRGNSECTYQHLAYAWDFVGCTAFAQL